MNAPNVELSGTGVAVLVGLMVGGVLIYKVSSGAASLGAAALQNVKDGALKVAGWVNPASDKNLAYSGVNAIGSAWTGQPDWNLGGTVYDGVQSGGEAAKARLEPSKSAAQTGTTYDDPLINNAGMDFGQLSG